ncbi:MAG TPA: putative LPS assembly protein LptD [Chryseolinea sp.]|nr:putative LPS assembly protein LptD [Chryseolinea sp.]
MRYILSITFLLFLVQASFGQVEGRVKPPRGALSNKTDSLSKPVDSITVPTDSLSIPADSVKQDSLALKKESDIETTITYSANDSIRIDVDGKMAWLYGDAKIKYGDVELEAEEIIIDYGKTTLTAHGIRDSLGRRVGYPIFKNGAEVYETKDIVYNFKTKRARISEVVTTQGEGFLLGDVVYKNEEGELLSLRNTYTTCNQEHPHYAIKATKTKAIPNDKIVAGPFYMEFNEIPLPFGFLFGMFPDQKESASGILFPTFGTENRRGFNMRGVGYFFDISEQVKLAVTADIYSKGSHALYVNSNYNKRYKYTGSYNFAYSKNPGSDNKIESQDYTKDYHISWNHSPQTKGTARFSASVNAATASFNKNNNIGYGTQDQQTSSTISNTTTKLSSNISFSKRFTGTPFSLGLNLSHNQDLVTEIVDLQLPSLSLNMTNIYPFLSKKGKTGPLDNFSVGYSMVAANRLNNNLGKIGVDPKVDSIAPFTQNFASLFANGRKGMRHTMPISFSFKALKFLTISPSVSITDIMYGEKQKWAYDANNVLKVVDTIGGFSNITNYSVSAGLTTRVYGTYYIKKKSSKVKAIRHVVNPSVSFGYTPDFTGNKEYFDSLYNKETKKFVYQSKHQGYLYGGSTTGKSGSIGFSLGNNVEMKVKSEEDSVARKVMLLNNLSFNTSYNLIADEFNLSPIGIAANTNVLNNKLNVNLSASLDPYSYVYLPVTNSEDEIILTETRINSYALKAGKIGRITSAALAVSTNLNPEALSKETSSREKIAKSDLPDGEKQFLLQNPDAYVDFEIPWSLNLSYNLSYSHQVNQKAKVTQTVNMNGDFSISKAWKITYSSGYHFESKEFTQTNIGITRDLHCWTMRVNWVPFGRFQSYNFTIAVKASILQDLKLERRKPFYDNL